MASPESPKRTHGLDAFGLLFIAAVIAAAYFGSAYAVERGWIGSRWEAIGLIVVLAAFVVAHRSVRHHKPPQNANVYGSAKTASEPEAQAAARGSMKSPSLHDRNFPD